MKNILALLSLAALIQPAHAQVSAGFKGGLNLTNVYNEAVNSKARIGFHAGGLLQVDLPNRLFLQPEALYSVKGFRSVANAVNNEADVSLNYINVPLLLGYRYTQNFAVAVGPEFGFLTSARSKFNGINNDVRSFYRKFDAGVDLDLGYSFTKSLGLNLRYNFGFKDLQNAVYADANGNITGQRKIGANRVLQVGICYFVGEKN